MTPLPRVLLADDDDVTLAGNQRILTSIAEVHVASSGEAALDVLAERGPFAVAAVEIGLIDMPGVEILQKLQERSPETVRVVLTAIDDLPSAVDAVNGGGVFRYLVKPCKPAVFITAIREALAHFHEQRARLEVLEVIHDGIVQLLTGEILSSEPELSAEGKKLRDRARQLGQVLRLPATNELETAAELMRIGLAAVPRHVLDKISAHELLDPGEAQRLQHIPEAGARVISHISRLSGVTEIISYDESKPKPDGARPAGPPAPGRRNDVPLAGRILRALIDLNLFEESGLTTEASLLRLRQDAGRYDRNVLKAMDALYKDPALAGAEIEAVMVDGLVSGMVLAMDAQSNEGVSLVAAGTTLTPGLIEHLRNFAELGQVVQPMHILRKSIPVKLEPEENASAPVSES